MIDRKSNLMDGLQLIDTIMLLYKILRGMSTFSQLRVYNNSFEWNDDKWNLAATIQSPKLSIEGTTLRLSAQSSLTFVVCALANKYQKGRASEIYNVKMQDMIKLGLWKPTMPIISFISTTKIVSFQRQDINSKNVLVSFYDKNLSEQQRRKEIAIHINQFQTFLQVINSGFEQITNGNQQKLSYIHQLMKGFPPVVSVKRKK